MHESNFTDVGVALAAMLAVPAAAQAAKPERNLYVSLGDSYASGFQPTAPGVGRNTRNGFAYQVPGLVRPRGYKLKLVNFGCSGETTVSLLERITACGGLGPGGVDYAGTTQLTTSRPTGRCPRRSPTSATSPTSASSATSTPANSGYRVIARLIARSLPRRG